MNKIRGGIRVRQKREIDIVEVFVEKEHMISLGERLHWHLKTIGKEFDKRVLTKVSVFALTLRNSPSVCFR